MLVNATAIQKLNIWLILLKKCSRTSGRLILFHIILVNLFHRTTTVSLKGLVEQAPEFLMLDTQQIL